MTDDREIRVNADAFLPIGAGIEAVAIFPCHNQLEQPESVRSLPDSPHWDRARITFVGLCSPACNGIDRYLRGLNFSIYVHGFAKRVELAGANKFGERRHP